MKMAQIFAGTMLLLWSAGLPAQSSSTAPTIQTLNKTTFQAKLKQTGVQLLDVRTPSEYSAGHINQAKNMNIYDPTFRDQAAKLDKTKPVAVYCKAGSRSMKAAQVLQEMGFKRIYNLEGGYLSWVN